jgi:hypothetical protein
MQNSNDQEIGLGLVFRGTRAWCFALPYSLWFVGGINKNNFGWWNQFPIGYQGVTCNNN